MKEEILVHVYNRGANKQDIFLDTYDYERMQKLLFVANTTKHFIMSIVPAHVFAVARGETLVDIVAYCLMSNHIHIAIRKRDGDNIPKFMQKLGTAYSTYFNKKYGHSGTIWQGTYKDKVEYNVEYSPTLVNYIHANPYRSKIKNTLHETETFDLEKALAQSKQYPYSSLPDYSGVKRPEAAILAAGARLPEVRPREVRSREVRPREV